MAHGGVNPATPEDDWIAAIREWYPRLQTETCFVPPIHFNRQSHDVATIAGQTVSVLDNPSARGPNRRNPVRRVWQWVKGKVFTENPATLDPVCIQDTDRQDDEATNKCLDFLHRLCDELPQVMVVVSQLMFRKYLDNVTNPAAVAMAQLPDVKSLPENLADGECDILIIHKHHGLIIGEVKSVGGSDYFSTLSDSDKEQKVLQVVNKALKQLNNQETVVKHLLSDVNSVRVTSGVAPIPVTKILLLPNITSGQLRQALDTCQPSAGQDVATDLCLCLNISTDVAQAVERCLCSDNLAKPDSWWNTVLPASPASDPFLTDDLYERLVARFCGPATTVEVATAGSPRKVIRSLGEAVAETGLRFSSLALTPDQVSLLDPQNEPQYMYLQGPPGCGKTVVLVLKGLQWLRQGRPVCVVSTKHSGRAVSTLLREQLLYSVGAAATRRPKIHQRSYDLESRGDRKRAVSGLVALARRNRHLAVIADEADPSDYRFQEFVQRIGVKAGTVSVWGAGMNIMKALPPKMCVQTISSPLRCPPTVTREVEKSNLIDNITIPQYTTLVQPAPTEGPAVRWLYHRDLPGHSMWPPKHCPSCADGIVDVLRELGVSESATSLQYSDVFILYDLDYPSSQDDLVERLRTYHGLPVRVVNYPPSDADVQELALSTCDELIVTDCDTVSGLERRVVIVLGSMPVFDVLHRAYAVSRSTAFVCVVHPNHINDSDTEKTAAMMDDQSDGRAGIDELVPCESSSINAVTSTPP